MVEVAGFTTYALVERFGANTASVTVRPGEHLPDVVRAASRAGIHLSVASGGRYSSALYWQPEDFDDDTLGLLADALTRCGVGSYAYHLSHADLFGHHVDMHVRVGTAFPLVGRRVLFVRAHVVRPHCGLGHGLLTCVFGAPDDLEALLPALGQRFVTEPCEHPDGGLASIMLQHQEVAGGLASVDSVIEDLADILEAQGFDAHILVHQPPPGHGPDHPGLDEATR